MKKNKTTKVVKTASAILPTKHGKFLLSVYRSKPDNREHVVLEIGEIHREPTLVRIHSQCLTGDALLSLRCDCGEQLHEAMKVIGNKGAGLIFYLNQEGRDIGLTNKIKAYALQEQGQDTVQANQSLGLLADARDYLLVTIILKKLEIARIDLLTNNPDKIIQLEKNGIVVEKRIPLEIKSTKINSFYLKTKKKKMGHILHNI